MGAVGRPALFSPISPLTFGNMSPRLRKTVSRYRTRYPTLSRETAPRMGHPAHLSEARYGDPDLGRLMPLGVGIVVRDWRSICSIAWLWRWWVYLWRCRGFRRIREGAT